jgi:hypothetical protein
MNEEIADEITASAKAWSVSVHLEVLADDNLDLPVNIPSPVKNEGIRRRRSRAKS